MTKGLTCTVILEDIDGNKYTINTDHAGCKTLNEIFNQTEDFKEWVEVMDNQNDILLKIEKSFLFDIADELATNDEFCPEKSKVVIFSRDNKRIKAQLYSESKLINSTYGDGLLESLDDEEKPKAMVLSATKFVTIALKERLKDLFEVEI